MKVYNKFRPLFIKGFSNTESTNKMKLHFSHEREVSPQKASNSGWAAIIPATISHHD